MNQFIDPAEARSIAKDAYIYGVPLVAIHKTMSGVAGQRADDQLAPRSARAIHDGHALLLVKATPAER